MQMANRFLPFYCKNFVGQLLKKKRVKFEVAMKKFYPYQQPQQQQQPQCKSSFYFCIFAFETVFKRFPNYTV